MKIPKPSSCQDCIFFKEGSYRDMSATIPFISCEVNQFGKYDGRTLHSSFKWRKEIFRKCTVFMENDYNIDWDNYERICKNCGQEMGEL